MQRHEQRRATEQARREGDLELVLESQVAAIKQAWNPIVFKAEMDLSADHARRLDRRLAMAAGILLMAIEGRQSS